MKIAGLAYLLGTFSTAMLGCLLSASCGIVFILIPRLCLPFLPQSIKDLCTRVHHFLTDGIAGLWFIFTGFLLENIYGIKIAYCVEELSSPNSGGGGDGNPRWHPLPGNEQAAAFASVFSPPPPGKFNIVMMNHRTRLDWMYFWTVLSRASFGTNSSLKITLKKPLSKVPFFGWTMQQFRFLFLSRRWTDDQAHLKRVIQHYKDVNQGATMLIFPEGTDLSEENLEKSQNFAKAKGLPQYRYILNPRTTGMDALREAIGEDRIHSITDVTVGYTDCKPGLRPSEKSFFNGTSPRSLHYLVRRYRFGPSGGAEEELQKDQIPPQNTEKFAEWISQRFHEKEELLADFYHQNPVQFNLPPPPPPQTRSFPGGSSYALATAQPRLRYAVVAGLWGLGMSLWIKAMFFSSTWWPLLATLGVYGICIVFSSSKFDGFDNTFFFRRAVSSS